MEESRNNKKPTPQLQWSPFMEEETATKLNKVINVAKFKKYIAELEEEATSNRIQAQAAEAELEKATKQTARQSKQIAGQKEINRERIEELDKEIAAMKLRLADK
jgi:uncharacterized protein involved in exopolysaccharide biosynthesis